MRFLARCLLVSAALAIACGDEDEPSDRFACGNGSCRRGAEICLIHADGTCSTCEPVPESCSASGPGCACVPPANDAAFDRCVDIGVCQDLGGGVVLSCQEPKWSCG